MRTALAWLGLGAAVSVASLATWAQADDTAPVWAYAVNPPSFSVIPDDGAWRHVPDSTAEFAVSQARDLFYALDWHPSDHLLLYDFEHGARAGPWNPLMAPNVTSLTLGDMVALAAHAASLPP